MSKLKSGLIQMSLKGDASMAPEEIRNHMLEAHLPLVDVPVRIAARRAAPAGVCRMPISLPMLHSSIAGELRSRSTIEAMSRCHHSSKYK